MKIKGLLLTVAIILAASTTLFAQKGITITPYARLGLNMLPPSMDDLDYVGDWSGADIKINPISSGAGLQVKLDKNGLGLGIDAGATTLFFHKVVHDQGVGVSTYTEDEYSVYLKFFAQKGLGDLFFVQGGVGVHINPWFYEYYYDSANYTDTWNSSSGTYVSYALHLAVGTEIPLSPKVNLFLLGKLEGIFAYGIMLPVSGNVGLSYAL